MKVISHISFRHWDFKCSDNEGKKSCKFTHTLTLFLRKKEIIDLRFLWLEVYGIPFSIFSTFFFNLKRNRI